MCPRTFTNGQTKMDTILDFVLLTNIDSGVHRGSSNYPTQFDFQFVAGKAAGNQGTVVHYFCPPPVRKDEGCLMES